MLSLSPDGCLLYTDDGGQPRVVELGDDGPRRATSLDLDPTLGAVACLVTFDDQVWLFCAGGALVLGRVGASGVEFGERLRLPGIGAGVAVAAAPLGPPSVLLSAPGRLVEVREDLGRLTSRAIVPAPDLAIPIDARRALTLHQDVLWLEGANGRERVADRAVLGRSDVLRGEAILGGKAIAFVLAVPEPQIVVFDLRARAVQHRFRLDDFSGIAFAGQRGQALLTQGRRLLLLDLRFGKVLQSWEEASPVEAVTIDALARRFALITADGLRVADLSNVAGSRPTEDAPAPAGKAVEIAPTESTRPTRTVCLDTTASVAWDAIARAARAAFGVARSVPAEPAASRALETELELVAAWCKRAIARAWDSGRLSFAAPDALPFAHEAAALFDCTSGRAVAELAAACVGVLAIEAQAGQSAHDTALAALAAEHGLSDRARQILLVVAAPQLRGELCRGYALVANDPARPTCDEQLVGDLIDPSFAARRAIARELDGDGPLVRRGLVELGSGARPFAALSVPRTVAALLAGDASAGGSVLVERRAAVCPLDDLLLSDEVKARLHAALASPERPLRLVVRGREGTGKRTLLAALAACAGRELGLIDARALAPPIESLRCALREATLRGLLPCLVGFEYQHEDPSLHERLRHELRAFDGPLTFACAPSTAPPLDSGYVRIDLPTPSEDHRRQGWQRGLGAAGLAADIVSELAAKYRVGLGVIARACRRHALEHGGLAPDDAVPLLEESLRQRRESRIAKVASRVTRLSSWSNVVLPAEILDSIRELCGRLKHRRTVFEEWGFDRLLTSSRGLTALFSGGPGTGKSMVAGIIARDLGYDLYRVDLSRVLSKWVGETEKNLATVFDAAEDGELVLLFDEADSLFAKRSSEVHSSNDRYANLEVNYLLERLDAFEGIAILTTNSESVIDPAFKRRLSFRVTFPFPDEEMRADLWRAHLPPELPREGEFDFPSLARKYQLSGGYIRNAAIRAAFLAAQEQAPVTHEHLVRAVTLEYREAGKLVDGGTLE